MDLFEAVGAADIAKVEELLAAGANVNAQRSLVSGTVLAVAAFNGSTEITRELIRAKANVNATDVEGGTALMV